jgi:hypothetical protein
VRVILVHVIDIISQLASRDVIGTWGDPAIAKGWIKDM